MTILVECTTTFECSYFDFLIRMGILGKVAGEGRILSRFLNKTWRNYFCKFFIVLIVAEGNDCEHFYLKTIRS